MIVNYWSDDHTACGGNETFLFLQALHRRLESNCILLFFITVSSVFEEKIVNAFRLRTRLHGLKITENHLPTNETKPRLTQFWMISRSGWTNIVLIYQNLIVPCFSLGTYVYTWVSLYLKVSFHRSSCSRLVHLELYIIYWILGWICTLEMQNLVLEITPKLVKQLSELCVNITEHLLLKIGEDLRVRSPGRMSWVTSKL